MAGHQMFHEATVHFTTDYINSLPRKLSEYTNIVKSSFKLLLVECEKGGFSCSGSVKNLASFVDEFPKYVSDEEKKAVDMLLDESKEETSKKVEIFVMMHCPMCEFNTRNVSLYRQHIRSHKAKLEKNHELKFTCVKCQSKSFQTKDLNVYIRHLKTIHSNKKNILCELCGLSFKRADALKNHKLHIHGPGPERRYACEQCPKSFRCKAHLDSHYRVHSQLKEHSCELCATKFKTEAALHKHMKYTHTSPKSFKCDQCNRGFGTKQNLNSHLAVHQREKDMLYDTEKQAREISQQIALHIQEQFQIEQSSLTLPEQINDVDMSSSVVVSAVASLSNSPSRTEAPMSSLDTVVDNSSALIQPLQDEHPEIAELTSVTLPPVYPSRPGSVSSQYAGFTEQQSRNDNHEDLDEIFPQCVDEPVENFDCNRFETESHQEELDLVFRQDVCSEQPHNPNQISRPGSVGSHHTDLSESRTQVMDGLLPAVVRFRRTINADNAVASPQSVCSNQFPCHSRPPSVGSQHSNYHEQTPISVSSYHASPYHIPPPEIVFSQPMSSASNVNHSDIQVLSDLYEKPPNTPVQSSIHFVHDQNIAPAKRDDDFSAIAKQLIGTSPPYVSPLPQSCFTDQYETSPHYASKPLGDDCVVSDSSTRCVTPQAFTAAHSFVHPSTETSRSAVNEFSSTLATGDTLLLPPNPSGEIVPELHTPNKNFPDNELVAGFSNILSS